MRVITHRDTEGRQTDQQTEKCQTQVAPKQDPSGLGEFRASQPHHECSPHLK